MTSYTFIYLVYNIQIYINCKSASIKEMNTLSVVTEEQRAALSPARAIAGLSARKEGCGGCDHVRGPCPSRSGDLHGSSAQGQAQGFLCMVILSPFSSLAHFRVIEDREIVRNTLLFNNTPKSARKLSFSV